MQLVDGRRTVGNINQQTGAKKPAFAVQIEDCLVDSRRIAQIVGVDDQFHSVSGNPGFGDIWQVAEDFRFAIIICKQSYLCEYGDNMNQNAGFILAGFGFTSSRL